MSGYPGLVWFFTNYFRSKITFENWLQRCLATQVLVILEQEPRLELQVVVIQDSLELLVGATLDNNLEEVTQDSSRLDKERLEEDIQGLVHLAPLEATQVQGLLVEDIQALVPLEGATLEQEELHREPPNKVDILEELQGVLQVVATQEVHLEEEATHLKASRVLILEQQHLHLLTLRLDRATASVQYTDSRKLLHLNYITLYYIKLLHLILLQGHCFRLWFFLE